jgi:hypothetical protein
MLALFLIVMFILDIGLFIIIWGFWGSMTSSFILIIKPISKMPLWILLFPGTWLLLLINLSLYLADKFLKNVIVPFNKKINGEK